MEHSLTLLYFYSSASNLLRNYVSFTFRVYPKSDFFSTLFIPEAQLTVFICSKNYLVRTGTRSSYSVLNTTEDFHFTQCMAKVLLMAHKVPSDPTPSYLYHLIPFCFSLAHTSPVISLSLLFLILARTFLPQDICTSSSFCLE